jgi:hypothetical protein
VPRLRPPAAGARQPVSERSCISQAWSRLCQAMRRAA